MVLHSDTGSAHWQWRSSKWFVLATVAVALFIEIFLYGFLVPMLPYMLEERLHLGPDQTQRFTSISLALHGLVSIFGGPLIGHFADKAPNHKIPFLIALLGCIIGTVMVACATSVGVFFGGRVLQGISGSGAWIVGQATATNAVDPEQIGTTMGILMVFVNAGMITGPMVSGFILEAAGYWFTWSVPVVLLLIDAAARLLIVENPERPSTKASTETDETESLLPSQERGREGLSAPSSNFWRIMLSNSRVMTALLIGIWGPTVGTSFNATLPLHVHDIFGWGPSRVGLMFFLLAVPGLLFSPLAGYLRDCIGSRKPASIALGLQAVFLALLGFAGNNHFDWAGSGSRGPALYILSIVTMGILRPFVSGVGPVELASVVKAEEAKNPGIFGPRGGYSRVFSLLEVAVTAGMTIGPVISGALVERFDYYRMTWTLSESFPLSSTPMVLVDLLRRYIHHHGYLSLYLPKR
ncbi:putative MFS transporter [Talaromyces proteolyticus]|uniref:MFS transporter n=1 Tax=Talaromyces proteolyticus TaxID=1131652 RepID=A0AAD4KG35_9EURO|nr:putative MFS transporter [Talaromyces proteolyticus]KAH8690231.1 putative MFS transporter [Talaromyces proteolyticus]